MANAFNPVLGSLYPSLSIATPQVPFTEDSGLVVDITNDIHTRSESNFGITLAVSEELKPVARGGKYYVEFSIFDNSHGTSNVPIYAHFGLLDNSTRGQTADGSLLSTAWFNSGPSQLGEYWCGGFETSTNARSLFITDKAVSGGDIQLSSNSDARIRDLVVFGARWHMAVDFGAGNLWFGFHNQWFADAKLGNNPPGGYLDTPSDPATGLSPTYSTVLTRTDGLGDWVFAAQLTGDATTGVSQSDLNGIQVYPTADHFLYTPPTGFAPWIVVPISKVPFVYRAELLGRTPLVPTTFIQQPAKAALTTTGKVPTLVGPADISAAPKASVTLASNAPFVQKQIVRSPAPDELGFVARPIDNAQVAQFAIIPSHPTDPHLDILGKAPVVRYSRRELPTKTALTLTSRAPLVDSYRNKKPAKVALTLTGNAPETFTTTRKPVPKAALALTGTVPAIPMFYRLDADMYPIEADGTFIAGNSMAVDADLPPLESDSTFGWQGDAELAPIETDATLSMGRVFDGFMILPALTGSSGATQVIELTLNEPLASIQADATALIGRIFSADIDLPELETDATFYAPFTFSGDADLAALVQGDSVLLVGSFLAGDGELRAIEGTGEFADATTFVYYGLSTNTFNLAHGGYTNTDYNGLGRLDTNAYAAMSDGLYRIDGETDAGVPIESYWLLGYEDFGVEALKAQRVAYVGFSSDGPMELLVRTDDAGDTLYEYSLETPHTQAVGDAPARVKLGRALRGRYWQIGMRNINGADFNIDRIGLGTWPSTRKR
jgi:hypothetical protein